MRHSIAGEQPKPCRSAGGNPSNRSLRSNGRLFRREHIGAARFLAVLVRFPRGYAFAMHLRLCGRAGRSYPSHSTSQALRSDGSEPHDANETGSCRFDLAQLTQWYEPAACTKPTIRRVNSRPDELTCHSSSERPLPADLAEPASMQAACSLCHAYGMHASRRQTCVWKAAADGMPRQCRHVPTQVTLQGELLMCRLGIGWPAARAA